MHELYNLQQTALEGYATYNFPKGLGFFVVPLPHYMPLKPYSFAAVMSALSHFATVTLSSLYFDITKDCLYADSSVSAERRGVITVLEQVCF